MVYIYYSVCIALHGIHSWYEILGVYNYVICYQVSSVNYNHVNVYRYHNLNVYAVYNKHTWRHSIVLYIRGKYRHNLSNGSIDLLGPMVCVFVCCLSGNSNTMPVNHARCTFIYNIGNKQLNIVKQVIRLARMV